MRFVLAAVALALTSAPAQAQVLAKDNFEKGPTPQQVLAVYPPAARADGVQGFVDMTCVIQDDDRIDTCDILRESPQGAGFGDAAKRLIRLFVMPHGQFGTHIIVPFVFNGSGDPFPGEMASSGVAKR